MNKIATLALGIVALTVIGCGPKEPPPGPVPGTLNLEGLTLEQKIQKVQNDPSIPDQYKQTYINSLKAQAGQH